ncbi:MAG: hypothetical protein M3Q03_06480 [Chloroflexota bacterium]|nr:hypothetical protein [Chloroflexota bacterium]
MEQNRRVLPDSADRAPMLGPSAIYRDDIRWAGVWLVLRVSLGSLWFGAGWRSLHEAASKGDGLAVARTLAGIALILGLLTGIAAIAGALLSADLVLSGTAPLMTAGALMAAWLVLKWRTAGSIGFDRWLVPALIKTGWSTRGWRGDSTGGWRRGA